MSVSAMCLLRRFKPRKSPESIFPVCYVNRYDSEYKHSSGYIQVFAWPRTEVKPSIMYWVCSGRSENYPWNGDNSANLHDV